MRTTAAVLLLACTLALSACDSGAPEPRPFVGTWTTTGEVRTWLVTSDRTQQIADPDAAGEGALTATTTGVLAFRYTRAYLEDGVPVAFMFFTAPPFAYPRPSPFATLYVNRERIQLAYDTGTTYTRDLAGGALPYTYTNGRLRMTPTTFASPGSSESVTVGGTLTPVWQTLEAGAEETVAHIVSPPSSVVWRYSFEASGSFWMDVPGRDDVPTYRGTWDDLGDGRLRVQIAYDGAPPDPLDYTYEVHDGQLLLTRDAQEFCTSTPECFNDYEFAFGMAPGSLRRVRTTEGYVLTPTAAR